MPTTMTQLSESLNTMSDSTTIMAGLNRCQRLLDAIGVTVFNITMDRQSKLELLVQFEVAAQELLAAFTSANTPSGPTPKR